MTDSVQSIYLAVARFQSPEIYRQMLARYSQYGSACTIAYLSSCFLTSLSAFVPFFHTVPVFTPDHYGTRYYHAEYTTMVT